jgi:hypothetical protein
MRQNKANHNICIMQEDPEQAGAAADTADDEQVSSSRATEQPQQHLRAVSVWQPVMVVSANMQVDAGAVTSEQQEEEDAAADNPDDEEGAEGDPEEGGALACCTCKACLEDRTKATSYNNGSILAAAASNFTQ